MNTMTRYLGSFGAAGAAVPVAAFLLSVVVPLFPDWLFAAVVFLCPAYVGFVATAACDAFDACSLEMLATVVALNIGVYTLIGLLFWFTRARWRAMRLALTATALLASAWWAKIWVWGA